jgi:predicted phosphodiesterase
MKLKLLKSFLLILTFNAIYAQNDTRFIIFGDTQFGNPPEFERMIYEASLLSPDFVIQVGDLIHGYTHNKDQLRAEWKRYKGQISLLNSPFYPVPGNHDVVTDEAEEVYAEVWGKDKLLYSFDKGSAHFIILNSWWGDEDDRIMQWQRDWLVNDLTNYSSQFSSDELLTKSIFVFLHSPLWKYPKNHEGRKDWDIVHNMLKKYPVKLVIGGHTHEHVYQNNSGIDYLVINSAGVRKENIRGGKFSSFLHVVVKQTGECEFAAIKAGSIYPLDTVDSLDRVEANKYNIEEKTILISEWNEGEELNKKVEVVLENKLNEERKYRLDWYIPFNSEIKIEPESKWTTVPAGTQIAETFLITSNNTPSVNLMPYLEISTSAKYRTGVLSRELESQYRNNEISIEGFEPAIKLEDNFIYKGKYNLFIPPSVNVKKLNLSIDIDGKIIEKDWTAADSIMFISGNEINTKLKFLYNKDYLYIAAQMDEPLISNLISTAEGEIPLTWNDDDIELFFDTEKSQRDYIRLFQNSAGTRFNSLQRWVEDKYFVSKYKSQISFTEDYWTIEFEIPWSDIDLDDGPNSGDEWAFNVGRHRQQSMVKQSKWAGGLYNPKEYGIMKFE